MESIRPEDEQTYQLEEIWKTTAHTTAWPQTPDCPTVEPFRITLRRHQDLNIILRAAIAAIAEAGLHDDTDFAHLKTLPLIGSANATTILAAARDLRRFGHHRQFLEYCGFNLRKIQSGTRRGREPFSQRDNVRLRLLTLYSPRFGYEAKKRLMALCRSASKRDPSVTVSDFMACPPLDRLRPGMVHLAPSSSMASTAVSLPEARVFHVVK